MQCIILVGVRGEIKHERIQGDGGSDMGAGEMFNKGGVRWDDRVALPTDFFTKERGRRELVKTLDYPSLKRLRSLAASHTLS